MEKDVLAKMRTRYASERTTLAWIRTGLTIVVSVIVLMACTGSASEYRVSRSYLLGWFADGGLWRIPSLHVPTNRKSCRKRDWKEKIALKQRIKNKIRHLRVCARQARVSVLRCHLFCPLLCPLYTLQRPPPPDQEVHHQLKALHQL